MRHKPRGRVDLHLHTDRSDGALSPEETVRYALDMGLRAIAITDHDTVEGNDDALRAGGELGVEVIPGVELSVDSEIGSLHMVGLFLRNDSEELRDALLSLRRSREERNPAIVSRLRAHGMPITMAEVAAEAEGVVGRPHIARVLLKRGYVENMDEAFRCWLRRGRPAYVDRWRIGMEDAIRLVHTAGGLALLAHPGTIRRRVAQLEPILRRWKRAGLDGIEVYFHAHTAAQTASFQELARRLDLAESGGSDFHGQAKPRVQMGVVGGAPGVPYSVVEGLRARLA